MKIKLTVNGFKASGEVEATTTLLHFIRETLGLTGTKAGCENGECGACTVLLDGRAVRSCLVLAAEADGSDVRTIEGLQGEDGSLHPLQEAFIAEGAVQCGFCTPGMLMAASSLLDSQANPCEEEIRECMEGHFCRCGSYPAVMQAIKRAGAEMNNDTEEGS